MPLIPNTLNPLTSSSTSHADSSTRDSSSETMSRRGAQSPPPEAQTDAQIGGAASGKQPENAQTSQKSKDEGKAVGDQKDYGTERLESNPEGPLKKWSEDIRKRPQDWQAPGGQLKE